MIFDHEVSFYLSEKKYDPKQSKYVGGDILVKLMPANVTDVGTSKTVELFGDYKQNSKVVRTFNEPPHKWSYLLIDGAPTHYVLQTKRQPLKLHTLIVGEKDG